MEALERAFELLKDDKDFKYLSTTANSLTHGTLWDSIADAVVDTWETNPYFQHSMTIEEYIAWYKAAMFFACAVTKVLEAMHVEDDDKSKMRKIPGTDKLVNVYTNPKPWMQRFIFDADSKCLQVSEEVSVEDITTNKYTDDIELNIQFKAPALQFDPKKAEYTVDYLGSDITIEVLDTITYEIEFERLKLKDLNVSRVLNVLKKAAWL